MAVGGLGAELAGVDCGVALTANSMSRRTPALRVRLVPEVSIDAAIIAAPRASPKLATGESGGK